MYSLNSATLETETMLKDVSNQAQHWRREQDDVLKCIEIKTILVAGLGETGSAIYQLVKGVYDDVHWIDPKLGVKVLPTLKKVNVLHACFPWCDLYGQQIYKYVVRYHPDIIIIEATVSPGTTRQIQKTLGGIIVHSPIRGNIHEGMLKCLLRYTKYIGGVNRGHSRIVSNYYTKLGLKTVIADSPEATEFAKILNTTYYGYLIAFWQELDRIMRGYSYSDKVYLTEGDMAVVAGFIGSTETESGGKVPRPVFHPGVIGGHCVMPNLELLKLVSNTPIVDFIKQSNDKTKQEKKQE